MGIKSINDEDHQAHSPTQLKEDPTRFKEVQEFAILCKKAVNFPYEFTPSSFNHNPVFVTCFVQDLVDPRFKGPHNILA